MVEDSYLMIEVLFGILYRCDSCCVICRGGATGHQRRDRYRCSAATGELWYRGRSLFAYPEKGGTGGGGFLFSVLICVISVGVPRFCSPRAS